MSALDTLSDHCGIVGSFVDARGEKQTTSADTRAALLAAMGIDARDEKGAAQALAQIQENEAHQVLPPVRVHYQTSGALEVPVTGHPAAAVRWRIELETGDVMHGVLLADPLPQLASAHLEDMPTRAQRWVRVAEKLPCGYHSLVIEPVDARCSLIVTSGKCWLPTGADKGRRLWGVAIQLYLLRSGKNWGIGDFGDLRCLVDLLVDRDADVVGLNPLHAMFTDDAGQASPYSPATRLLLNVLNIDVGAVAQAMTCEPARMLLDSASFRETLSHCRAVPLVDYPAVAALKLAVLRELFACSDRISPQWQQFVAFRGTAGPSFERGCLFLALRSHFAESSSTSADWHQWNETYRKVDAPGTLRFAKEQAEEVTFQAWLQYLADTQLQDCSDAAKDMAIGLYRDLAVGANPTGAETWANPGAVVEGAQVGAPPDIYNPQGQGWGLPPFHPQVLRDEGYRSFIELVRANMRHAGGLRIDHVMALQQLYWVPTGFTPAQGAYVRYPLEDLVGILALESQRNECLVVGEDLGTVPAGFRERMAEANILSYRVLLFEKDDDGFIAPEEYPQLALAVAGSHDLPTLRAWWSGRDLVLKERLNLYPTPEHAAQAHGERDADREAMALRLQANKPSGAGDIDAEAFVDAAHTLLARARSLLTMLQIDDLTGEEDPVNVPTTSDEHPNWRRRQSVTLEELPHDPRFNNAVTAAATLRRAAP